MHFGENTDFSLQVKLCYVFERVCECICFKIFTSINTNELIAL